jgi:hypothetical protein
MSDGEALESAEFSVFFFEEEQQESAWVLPGVEVLGFEVEGFEVEGFEIEQEKGAELQVLFVEAR